MRKKIALLLLVVSLGILSACGKKEIVCKEGEVKIDGVCEITKSAIDKKLSDTSHLTNYTLDVSIRIDETVSDVQIKFDNEKSLFKAGHMLDYYIKTASELKHIYETKDGFKSEVVKSESSQVGAYDFYGKIKESDLTSNGDTYLLNYSSYDLLEGFRKSVDRNAVITNFIIRFDESYINTIEFDVTVSETVYLFICNFNSVNQTKVEVPTHV
ncbi:MAG TPA: hypothetical protein VJY66_04145 [Acholeplasma sp.]|nr:hypothetical protein [Acholeplasma sp.]